jgi:hypothetical protein
MDRNQFFHIKPASICVFKNNHRAIQVLYEKYNLLLYYSFCNLVEVRFFFCTVVPHYY